MIRYSQLPAIIIYQESQNVWENPGPGHNNDREININVRLYKLMSVINAHSLFIIAAIMKTFLSQNYKIGLQAET